MTELLRHGRTLRDDRAFHVAFFALFVVALVPIWSPRLLPLLDEPNHLSAIAIWNHLGDPSWGFDRFYDYSRVPVPYWGYYFPVHLLSYVFPIETANKLFLSAYAFAVPFSVALYADRFDRSPWLSLLIFPLIFNHSFAWGFLSFTPALPLALLSLVSLVDFVREPSPLRLVGFLALVEATYFMHVLPWMLLGILAVIYLAGHLPDWRRVVPPSAALLLSLGFTIWNTIYCSNTDRVVGHHIRYAGAFQPFGDVIRLLPTRLIMRWPDGHGAEWVLVAMAVSFVALLVTARRDATRRDATRRATRWIDSCFPEVCLGGALACYLFLPVKISQPVWIWYVNTRFAALAAMLVPLVVRGSIVSWRRALVTPASVAMICYSIALTVRFEQFNAHAAGMFTALEKVPRGATVLTLMLGDNVEPMLDPETVPFNEFYSYPSVFRGGYDPYGWSFGFPFIRKRGTVLPAPPWHSPRAFDQRSQGSHYDFVLTHNERRDGEVFGDLAPTVKMIVKDGEWRLYATKGIVR